MRSSASAIALAEPTTTALAAPMDTTICVHPFRFDPHLSIEIPVLRWPEAADARASHARAGTPCLLLVGATERAPARWSELEDWVRETAPGAEFVTRATTVARRADLLHRPRLDYARVVRFRGRTVVVPEAQVELVALLVERFGETVADAEIRVLCDEGGASTHSEALKTAMRRLKDTLAPLGLHLARVRAAGYLLDRSD
jgi:DNA-binding response OmpR family regulator